MRVVDVKIVNFVKFTIDFLLLKCFVKIFEEFDHTGVVHLSFESEYWSILMVFKKKLVFQNLL